MLIQNQIKYLDDREITLIYYSWEAMAPDLYEISLYFFNEIYEQDLKKIPSKKVDINKFSLKALNTIGYVISNLEKLYEVKRNLYPMLVSLRDFGKLKPISAIILKKAIFNSIKKKFGDHWKPECGLAWLKLTTYLEKEIMVNKSKGKPMRAPNWN